MFVGRVLSITPKSYEELQGLLMAKLPPDVQSKASGNVDQSFRAEARRMLARAQNEVYLDLWGADLTDVQRKAIREHDASGYADWLLFEGRRVQLQVEEWFVGDPPTVTTVDTGYGGGDCGFDFVVGEEYLVVAHRLENWRYRTSICAGTGRVQDETQSLRALRKWKAR